VLFRIRKGTHISHFKENCPLWPRESYYEQLNPLWWGNLCVECLKLADAEAKGFGDGALTKPGTEP
jgi:hypothetical protein